jgi:hypothetical protein
MRTATGWVVAKSWLEESMGMKLFSERVRMKKGTAVKAAWITGLCAIVAAIVAAVAAKPLEKPASVTSQRQAQTVQQSPGASVVNKVENQQNQTIQNSPGSTLFQMRDTIIQAPSGKTLEERDDARRAVRPLVSIEFLDDPAGTGWYISNTGSGDAVIRWFRVLVDGTAVRDVQDLVDRLKLGPVTLTWQDPLPDLLIRPAAQKVPFVRVNDDAAAAALQAKHRHVQLELCHCSIYDECSITTMQRVAGRLRRPVTSCDLPTKS